MGKLSARGNGWTRFLRREANASRNPTAFVARNFLLEDGLTAERVASYEDAGCVADHASSREWRGRHEVYLRERVYRQPPGDGPPSRLNPGDEDACPETFRFLDPGSGFLSSDPKVELLRVERLRFVARYSGASPEAVKNLARGLIDASDAADRRLLEAELETWARGIQLRPVYCGFVEDVLDLFGRTPAEDPADWADRLRDRLGLIHLDPGARRRDIDILVFRYPVSAVPRLKGRPRRRQRPLVPPTVLDGSHSPAFFPAPRGSLTGHAVDLAAEEAPLCREVLHPTVAFRVSHLWRIGTIRRPVKRKDLPTARGMHILRIRGATQRPDYAQATDYDLL